MVHDRSSRFVALWLAASIVLLFVVIDSTLRVNWRLRGEFPRLNPFDQSGAYSFDSLIARYWLPGLASAIVLFVVARGLWNERGALVVVAFAVSVGALCLAMTPIASYPEHADRNIANGRANCTAIMFGTGPYADNDETCFDVRSTRSGDVLFLTAASGAMLTAAAIPLERWKRVRTRRHVELSS